MPRLKLIKTEEKQGFKRFYYQLKNQPDKVLVKSYYKGHLILRKVYNREALGLPLPKNRKEEEEKTTLQLQEHLRYPAIRLLRKHLTY